MSMETLLYFIFCETHFIYWSEAMHCGKTTRMDKSFCKSTDSSFDRSTALREGNTISKVSVYSRKNIVLPLPCWKWSNVTSTHQVIGRKCCHIRDSILVSTADRLDTSSSQVILSKYTSMILSPCINSTPAIMVISLMSPLGNDKSGRGKRLLSTEQVILSTH